MDNDKIKFKVFSPGGNITALVYEPVPAKNYAEIARAIMAAHSDIEQVGFLKEEDGGLLLEMMGGEFCGNAARCMVYEYCKFGQPFGVSGFKGKIKGFRQGRKVKIELPGNFLQKMEQSSFGPVVHLQGISFLIVPWRHKNFEPLKLLRSISRHRKAAGLLMIKKHRGVLNIEPLIYVPATKTLVQETACGSGSIAAAIVQAKWGTSSDIGVNQPSGKKFKVRLEFKESKLAKIYFSGPVQAEGTGSISFPGI